MTKAFIPAGRAQIEWWDDEDGRVRDLIVFERVSGPDGRVIFPAGVESHINGTSDNSIGACVAGWMTDGDPRHTPEGAFMVVVRCGFADDQAHLQVLKEFGKIQTCQWARKMAAALEARIEAERPE